MLGLGSCVSFLPPASLHQDMIQNQHPVLSDSLAENTQLVYGNIDKLRSSFHHNGSPEMEKNKGYGLNLGYGYANRTQSAGVSFGYTAGNMFDKEDLEYAYSTIIFRGSYALDFHENKWHGHILKLQGAASKGSGRYQNLLAAEYPFRDEYNLAIPDGAWLWSIGYGSAFYYVPNDRHQLGLGMSFNHSTDFDNKGFRAEFFDLDLSYVYSKNYKVHIGGMLDGRLTPRAETIYFGAGYQIYIR
jgi:hypothetical protein